MNELYVNGLVNDTETGAQYLVLWVAPGNEYGYWHDLNSSSKIPIRFVMADVAEGQSNGRYEVETFKNSNAARSDETLNSKEREHRDRIWGILGSAVLMEPDIYEAATRAEILRKTAAESGTDRAYLYKLLDRYWRSGKAKNAFIPAYSNSGAKGRQRSTYKKRTGQLSSEDTMGKTLTNSDRENFAAAIKRYYLNRQKISFKAVYEKLLQDFYTQKSDGDGKLKLLAPSEIPSLRQFQYWYSKNRDIVTEQKKCDGERDFELTSRAIP